MNADGTLDPRIEAACKASRLVQTDGACDGFPDPCDMCDCFYTSLGADRERRGMRYILDAADAVDSLRTFLEHKAGT